MVGWKLLAVADLLITAGYWFAVLSGREEAPAGLDRAQETINLVGLVGLVSYSFNLPTLPPLFWAILLPMFMASIAWELATVPVKGMNAGGWMALALLNVLAAFTSLALYRLADL
jgi:hypothetical protein